MDRHDGRVNDRARAATSFLVVRFGERPRQVRLAVLLTVAVSAVVLVWSRPVAAALLVLLPLLLIVRHQRRALVVVRPAGPLVVKGWWHDTRVEPGDVTAVQWVPRGDSASLRLVLRDAQIDCLSVAIPTGTKPRRRDDEGWQGRVQTLVAALEEVGVHPFALDEIRRPGR
jgi:hypothetical protein